MRGLSDECYLGDLWLGRGGEKPRNRESFIQDRRSVRFSRHQSPNSFLKMYGVAGKSGQGIGRAGTILSSPPACGPESLGLILSVAPTLSYHTMPK